MMENIYPEEKVSIEDQIEMLEDERASIEREYKKKLRDVDKKIKNLKSQQTAEEAAQELEVLRNTFLASGMSEGSVDGMLRDLIASSIKK